MWSGAALPLCSLQPSEVHEYLSRVLYNRRNKFNPLWNHLVVGGVQLDGTSFLGVVDLLGSNYVGDCVATGFGNYLAMPLLRRQVENQDPEDIDEDTAKRAMEESLRVLFYRDCVTTSDVQFAFIRREGTATVEPEYRLDSSWEVICTRIHPALPLSSVFPHDEMKM